MGLFLYSVLGAFAPLCEERGDSRRAGRYRSERERLAAVLEQSWDGEWYRRAYFDDGTPLGSAENDEGRIDSVAQTWAVLSGAAPLKRAERAMNAVRSHLVRRRFAGDPAPGAALRPHGARPGLHQGLPTRSPRERWTVHPRGAMGRPRAGASSAAETRRWSSSTCSTRSTTRAPLPTSSSTRRNPMPSPATSTTIPLTAGAAGGPGTRDRPAGCIASRSKASSDCAAWARSSPWTRAFRRPGRPSRSSGVSGPRSIRSIVENPERRCRGVASVALDGAPVDATAIPLVDDGGVHRVRVILGATSAVRETRPRTLPL